MLQIKEIRQAGANIISNQPDEGFQSFNKGEVAFMTTL